MSAGYAVQASLVSRLRSFSELSGVYDGPPARAAYPYVIVDCGVERDWSAKDLDGRELLVALTIWDDQPARLQRLADAIEDSVGRSIEPVGWNVASWRFQKRRTIRDVAGPWASAIDFRARLIALL